MSDLNAFGRDPAVRVIDDDDDSRLTMDEWLASLKRHQPPELPITAAELVAEGRRARSLPIDVESDE